MAAMLIALFSHTCFLFTRSAHLLGRDSGGIIDAARYDPV
jgi:hypothetical protein